MFRVGLGQDSHRFSTDPTRKLMLAGIEVRDGPGLAGHSDADVVLHALCRALEQAIGTDEFSTYADEMSRRGIDDSRQYVAVARSHVEQAGYRVNNVGVTIEARMPKIDPLRQAFKASIAAMLDIPVHAVGINASTGDNLTAFGRGEGIQVFAIVSLVSDSRASLADSLDPRARL